MTEPSLRPAAGRRPPRRWWRFGLIERTIVALAMVALAPLAVVPFLVQITRDAVVDQGLRTHALAARTTAERIGAAVATTTSAAGALARNPIVVSAPRSEAGQALLRSVIDANPSIAAVVIENAAGEEVIRLQVRELGAVARAVLAAPSTEALVTRREVGQLWLRAEASLDDATGRLRVVADGSSIDAQVRTEELGDEAQVAVGSADGLVSGSEPGLTLESFPAGLVAAAASLRVSGARRESAPDGRVVLGAHAPVPGTPW